MMWQYASEFKLDSGLKRHWGVSQFLEPCSLGAFLSSLRDFKFRLG